LRCGFDDAGGQQHPARQIAQQSVRPRRGQHGNRTAFHRPFAADRAQAHALSRAAASRAVVDLARGWIPGYGVSHWQHPARTEVGCWRLGRIGGDRPIAVRRIGG